jgi:hypothetical protein
MINRILIFLLLLCSLSTSAQLTPIQDTVPPSGSLPFVPTYRYKIINGKRIPYLYYPTLNKYDAIPTGGYIRSTTVSKIGGTKDSVINSDGTRDSKLNYVLLGEPYPQVTPTSQVTSTAASALNLTYANATYTATSATNYAVLNGKIPATYNGYIQATYTGDVNNGGVIAIDVNNSGNPFANWQCQLYVYNNEYYYAEKTGIGTNTHVTAIAGDLYRIRHTGSTNVAEYSRNLGSTWNALYTFAFNNPIDLYYKVGTANSGNAINGVSALSYTSSFNLGDNDLILFNGGGNTFKSVANRFVLANYPITIYGGVADGTTDNLSVFTQLKALSAGTRAIYFPQNAAGNANYYISDANILLNTVLDADPGVKITVPTTNGITFASTTFKNQIAIYSVDRDNTGIQPRNDVPNWIFKAIDNIDDKIGAQRPTVNSALTFTDRLYRSDLGTYTTGVATVNSKNNVSWTKNSIVSQYGIDVVGSAPQIGYKYDASVSNTTIPAQSTATSGMLVDFGSGFYYFYANYDGTYYIGKYTNTVAYTQTPVLGPWDPEYYPNNTGSSVRYSYRIIDATTVEFYVDGIFMYRATCPANIQWAGVGYGGTATSGGAGYAADFTKGLSPKAHIGLNASVVFVGDSRTFGEGSNLRISDVVKRLLEGKRGMGQVGVTNLAVSGQNAAQQAAILNGQPIYYGSAYVINVGTNDIQQQTDTASFKASLRQMVRKVKAGSAYPILCIPGIYNSKDITGYGFATSNYNKGGYIRQCVEVVAAEEGGVVVSDIEAALGAINAGSISLRDNIHEQPDYVAAEAAEDVRAIMDAIAPKDVYSRFLATAIGNNVADQVTFNTVPEMMAYTGSATHAYVKAPNSGGYFDANPAIVVTNYYNRYARAGGGAWVRQADMSKGVNILWDYRIKADAIYNPYSYTITNAYTDNAPYIDQMIRSVAKGAIKILVPKTQPYYIGCASPIVLRQGTNFEGVAAFFPLQIINASDSTRFSFQSAFAFSQSNGIQIATDSAYRMQGVGMRNISINGPLKSAGNYKGVQMNSNPSLNNTAPGVSDWENVFIYGFRTSFDFMRCNDPHLTRVFAQYSQVCYRNGGSATKMLLCNAFKSDTAAILKGNEHAFDLNAFNNCTYGLYCDSLTGSHFGPGNQFFKINYDYLTFRTNATNYNTISGHFDLPPQHAITFYKAGEHNQVTNAEIDYPASDAIYATGTNKLSIYNNIIGNPTTTTSYAVRVDTCQSVSLGFNDITDYAYNYKTGGTGSTMTVLEIPGTMRIRSKNDWANGNEPSYIASNLGSGTGSYLPAATATGTFKANTWSGSGEITGVKFGGYTREQQTATAAGQDFAAWATAPGTNTLNLAFQVGGDGRPRFVMNGRAAGDMMYQTTDGYYIRFGIGPANSILQSDGTKPAWVTPNFLSTPNNFRNNAATFTLPLTNLTNYGTFYGTTATWTLGTVAAGSNVTYYIKNAGSGVLTINSAAGGNDIYYTSAVATISISAGNAIIIHNDGVNWQVE